MVYMNDQQLDDLKQFIEARLSQTEQRIKDELQQDIEKLRLEMHDGFAGVGDAIEEINKRIDEHAQQQDQRLTRLEQQPA